VKKCKQQYLQCKLVAFLGGFQSLSFPFDGRFRTSNKPFAGGGFVRKAVIVIIGISYTTFITQTNRNKSVTEIQCAHKNIVWQEKLTAIYNIVLADMLCG